MLYACAYADVCCCMLTKCRPVCAYACSSEIAVRDSGFRFAGSGFRCLSLGFRVCGVWGLGVQRLSVSKDI